MTRALEEVSPARAGMNLGPDLRLPAGGSGLPRTRGDEPFAEGCELGPRARVREESQIHEGTRTGTDVVFELECHMGVANTLGDGVHIGRGVHAEANVTIGKEARIGDDCVLVDGTMVAEGTEVTDGTMTEQDQHVG